MDTSELYIKQCEKAEEIQGVAPVETRVGGYCDGFSSIFFLPQEKRIALLHWDNDEGHWMIGGYHQETEGAVWLPRQDQLQEIIGLYSETGVQIHCWASLTNEMMRQTREYHYCENTTLEQLWLAFAMKEKYGKHWDKEKENWELIYQTEMRKKYLDGK